jgi:hypothetical protein
MEDLFNEVLPLSQKSLNSFGKVFDEILFEVE